MTPAQPLSPQRIAELMRSPFDTDSLPAQLLATIKQAQDHAGLVDKHWHEINQQALRKIEQLKSKLTALTQPVSDAEIAEIKKRHAEDAELFAVERDHPAVSAHTDRATLLRRQKVLEAELRRHREVQFSPTGDNHHNAVLCPYCNPDGRLRAQAVPSIIPAYEADAYSKVADKIDHASNPDILADVLTANNPVIYSALRVAGSIQPPAVEG